MGKTTRKLIANNKKAYHDYFVEETYEAGIALCGTEVKSVRLGHVSIKESYVQIRGGEAIIVGMHISPYEKGNIFNREPLRERKLLLHKTEIRKLEQALKEKGLTVIPLSVVLSGKYVKVDIGLCRGKKLYDKRRSIAEKDAKREAQRELKERAHRNEG